MGVVYINLKLETSNSDKDAIKLFLIQHNTIFHTNGGLVPLYYCNDIPTIIP